MKYGIITHYDVHNHGALLQLNAMVKILKSKGIDAKALRFDKNYDFMGVGLKAKYNPSIKSAGIYLRYFWQNGLCKTFYNYKKSRTLNLFRKEEDLIGPYYSEARNIEATIVGSDEVFALHTGPTPVLFGHACPGKKVFCYAGCFGPTNYEDIERLNCIQFVKSGLGAMAGVSVRDANSGDIAKRLIGKDAVRVCDPVLLYGYEKERASFGKIDMPPYLLVYAYDNNMNTPEEVEVIKTYARKRHLKIVSPGFYHAWCDKCVDVDPVNLLNWFAQAACVVTDTFHGSVMSILTNRPMAVNIRGNSNKLQNLLEEYGLLSRIMPDFASIEDVMSKQIDFHALNGEIERRRAESMKFLNKMIEV